MIQQLKYKPHRFAKLVPEPTANELEELTKDIKENGQRFPVVLFEGEILDGRSRQIACHKAGVDLRTENYSPKRHGADPLTFVVSTNFRRRQLQMSAADKAAYVVENILPVFEQQAKERQVAGAKAPAGRLASDDAKGKPSGNEEVKSDTKKSGKAVEQAAKVTGVSASSIERAKAKAKAGKMTAKEKDEKERADALARIEKVLGKDAAFFTATRAKGKTHGTGPQTLQKTRPLVAFSNLDAAQMRKVEGLLLSSTMTLKAAIAFDNRKKVTEKSTLRDLFYLAAANGFELFSKVGIWQVEIYRAK